MTRDQLLGRSFFILSTARSGSTSLARILDTANDASCVIEPSPNLAREHRAWWDGRDVDAATLVEETIVPRVVEALGRHSIYGEKNVTYGPFIRALWERLGCRFVFLVRDGRDVVRSLLDWHAGMFGDIYRECGEPGPLEPAAVEAAAALPAWRDESDYARPRPVPGDPWFERWEGLTRAEMCAWYWSRSNAQIADALSELPAEAWIQLDYTRPDASNLREVADFLGLDGMKDQAVGRLLGKRINSIEDRGARVRHARPWTTWTSRERDAFTEIAGPTMTRLGLWERPGDAWRPADYGRFWNEDRGGLEWWEWMYDSRRRMHEELIDWVHAQDQGGRPIKSILDVGCGYAVGLSEAFRDKRYVGADVSQRNVDWCRENRRHTSHDYWNMDLIRETPPERFDLVMSSGTIDNVYDVDGFLEGLTRASRGWIYVTAYRGWSPELARHHYRWSPEHGCFYVDLSPARLREQLSDLGCTEIRVERRQTGRSDIPSELRLSARVPQSATAQP